MQELEIIEKNRLLEVTFKEKVTSNLFRRKK